MNSKKKVMFIVYHDINTEARSQEILECATIMGEAIFVSYSKPDYPVLCKKITTGEGKRNYFSFIKESIKAIKKEKPDIVILHDNYTSLILRWIKRNQINTFVIFDSSELYIDRKPTSLKTFISSHMNFFEKKYLKFADVVIAANIERANIMKEYYQLKELPLIFDNIHRIDEQVDYGNLGRKYYNFFNGNSFNLVYGGGISKQRMTYELADAVGKLGSNYKLLIVGRSSKTEKQELNKFLETNNYSNVYYEGFVSRSELKYLFEKAHLSVSVFSQDNLNNKYCASGKLYESLFEGTPILVSENPPLKRICDEYGVGVSTINFYDGIKEIENKYDNYCENVKLYTEKIDVKKRISNLASILLKEKIE